MKGHGDVRDIRDTKLRIDNYTSITQDLRVRMWFQLDDLFVR